MKLPEPPTEAQIPAWVVRVLMDAGLLTDEMEALLVLREALKLQAIRAHAESDQLSAALRELLREEGDG